MSTDDHQVGRIAFAPPIFPRRLDVDRFTVPLPVSRDPGFRWADNLGATEMPASPTEVDTSAHDAAAAQAADQALHDQFAGQALAAVIDAIGVMRSTPHLEHIDGHEVIASTCYDIADAMMRERGKRAIQRAQSATDGPQS